MAPAPLGEAREAAGAHPGLLRLPGPCTKAHCQSAPRGGAKKWLLGSGSATSEAWAALKINKPALRSANALWQLRPCVLWTGRTGGKTRPASNANSTRLPPKPYGTTASTFAACRGTRDSSPAVSVMGGREECWSMLS